MSEIKILVVDSNWEGPGRQPPEAFWGRVREHESFSNKSVEQIEAYFCRDFGQRLHERLVSRIRDEIKQLDRGVFGADGLRMFGKFLDHRLRFMRPEKEWPSWSDPIAKFFEFRQRVLSENEEYTAILGRMTAAAGVTFATRIRGYGSLELDVAVGSVEKLARAFDDNFDAVRVFLDCFVPLAFADVFDVYVSGFSEQMKFDVKADTSLEREFSKARKRRAKVAAENATEAGDESTCTGSA